MKFEIIILHLLGKYKLSTGISDITLLLITNHSGASKSSQILYPMIGEQVTATQISKLLPTLRS